MSNIIKIVLVYALSIYLVLLIGRLIISWIQQFSRSWRPSGIVLVMAEAIYTATDPPLRFLRRYIPTVRLGSVALDLSFMLLFLVIIVLLQVV
ncbi:MAG TPA: YggT family protein [Candidatus Saccharimonadales bacterium]|nr:YggT family protein [Candidatus Saccharimonadales bacterium]